MRPLKPSATVLLRAENAGLRKWWNTDSEYYRERDKLIEKILSDKTILHAHARITAYCMMAFMGPDFNPQMYASVRTIAERTGSNPETVRLSRTTCSKYITMVKGDPRSPGQFPISWTGLNAPPGFHKPVRPMVVVSRDLALADPSIGAKLQSVSDQLRQGLTPEERERANKKNRR
jgi:hypothetical protein